MRIPNIPLLSLAMLLTAGPLPMLSAQTDTLSNPSSCGLALPLTDNNCPENGVFFNPDLFLIEVTDAPAGVLGVDVFLREVRLIIRHEWDSDLDLVLLSPGGVSVNLSLDNGGSDENYGNPDDPTCSEYAAFTVGSCTPVTDGVAPFTDVPYAPEESFYNFNDGTTTANGLWTLQICDDVDRDTGSLRFVHLIFEPISCLPVETVQVNEVDSTAVELDWNEAGGCETTIVEYGPPGFTPGVDSLPGGGEGVAYGACPPFLLTGLAENTDYEIYVRKYCSSSGAFSSNACPVQITTGCLPPPTTIATTFDTLDQCPVLNCGAACTFGGVWRNDPAGDDLDWYVNQGMTPTSNTGPTAGVGGSGKYVYLETTGSSCNNGREAYLRSHCIQLDKQGTDSCHLSFNYHMFGINVGALRLEATTDGGATWVELWSETGNQGPDWRKTYLSLAAFDDGQVLQFRFVGVGSDGSRGDIALDNIVFHGSLDLGPADNTYWLDADGDGYGRPGGSLMSCAVDPPPGYAANPDDCNDTSAAINPGQPEVLCDQIDNNCNGIADDAVLPPPVVTNDTVCSGQQATICGTAGYDGNIFWFASPDSTDFIGFGNCLSFTYANDTPGPDVYTFYAEEVDPFCRSATRAEARIVVYPNPAPATTDAPAICPGQSFNLASLSIQDANFTGGTLTFHSGTPATAANELPAPVVTPSAPTTYFYRILSPQGCTGEGSVLVDLKPGPQLSFDPGDSLSLCRDNVAAVEVIATGGSLPYTYLWSTGESEPAIEVEAGFVPGTTDAYGVTVTDAEGCFSTDTLLVTTTSSIDSVRRFVTPVSICDGSNGSITVIPLNGQPPFSYQWSGTSGQSGDGSGVADTIQITGLQQGAYRITVTDSSPQQCAFVTRQVVVNGPDVIVDGVTIDPVNCAGAGEGEVCVEVSSLTGATPSFLWSDGQDGACASNLTGGTYSVTIEGGMCTTVLDNLGVPEPDSLRIKPTLIAPSCNAAADGRIELIFFGGTPDYSVSWNIPQSGPVIDGLTAGVYIATVSDANGCTLTDTLELIAPPPLTVQLDSLAAPSCFGYNDAFVLVRGQGGTSPYQYEWSNGTTAPALTQAAAGAYGVTVTDFNGCQSIFSLQMGQPAPVSLILESAVDPICVGDRTGEIAVSAGGGTAPYSYQWSTGVTDSLLVGLGVGTYTVTATDANACPADSLTVTLAAESFLDLNVLLTAPACEGPHTGSIEVQPEGIPPFTYEWSTGETDSIARFLQADGEYTVTITDGRECIFDTTFQLLAPQEFSATYFLRDPSCAGGSDGLIDVNLTNLGTPPFQYHWSDGASTLDRFGLPETMLQLTILDTDSCTFISPLFELEDPPVLSVQLDALGDISCAGDGDGFIEITPLGGTPPYDINWLGIADDTEDQYGLAAGEYRLLLQDNQDCPLDTTFVVTEPPALNVGVNVEVSDECDPDIFNRLMPEVSGGTPPYTFQWSNGATDSLLLDLPPGDYALTVQDANECAAGVASIKVREQVPPIQLDTFFVTNISCNGAGDGSATATITGGSPPYLFFFSTTDTFMTSQTTVTLTGLSQGSNYSVTVTDLNALCSVQSAGLAITNPPILSMQRDSVRQIGCEPGAVFSTTFGGTPPYSYAWYDADGAEVGSGSDFFTSTPGTYFGVVTDGRGCVDSTQATTLFFVGEAITLADTLLLPVACRGDSTGAIDLTLNGGAPPFAYQWSHGFEGEDPTGLPAGLYSVTVTDELGCTAALGPFAVTEPEAGLSIQSSQDDVTCFGGTDGSIEAVVSGGNDPYDYQWLQGGIVIEVGQPRVDDLAAGDYRLRVEDEDGCVRFFDFTLTQPDSLAVNLNADDQSVTVDPEGGTPPYEYLWNTGDQTPSTPLTGAGWYACTVTDGNECIAVDSILITGSWEVSKAERVELFPNPGKDWVTVVLEWEAAAETRVVFYDILGKAIKEYQLGVLRKGKFELEVSELPIGGYWVGVYANGTLRMGRKWIKLVRK